MNNRRIMTPAQAWRHVTRHSPREERIMRHLGLILAFALGACAGWVYAATVFQAVQDAGPYRHGGTLRGEL